MRAYEQFARLIADEGVRSVFGVLGDGNMHWVAAYRTLPACEWRAAWHESGAVWMADGYAMRIGDVGVATVTMGPGLAQALPALMTATRARRPIVIVTAAVPDTQPPHAQFANQADLVAAAGARYVPVAAASGLAAGLAQAMRSAREGVPAVLAVDLGVFEHAEAAEQLPARAEAAAPALDDDQLIAAVQALTAAARPLFLLGGGVRDSGCVEATLVLGRRVGAAFATTIGGRTALGDEPWDLGVVGMMANPLARELAAQADVVVVLGSSLDRYNTDGGRLADGALLVRVDRRPPDQLWSPGTRDVHVTGELPAVIAALSARVAASASSGFRTDETRAALEREAARQSSLAQLPTRDGINPWAVVAELDRQLPGDAHVVVGIGHFWYFVAPYLSARPQRTLHFTHGFASIGQAIPVGVGAALAPGTGRVVVVEGDGSAVMNIQELQAAVGHGADLLVIVLDNEAYASEYHKLAIAGLDPSSSTFADAPFDLVAVATAMGALATRTDDLDSFAAALRELLPERGVRLIDVRISVETMSETYVRQHLTRSDTSDAATTPSHSAAWTHDAPSGERSR